MATWTSEHHWAAMALQAVDATADVPGWTTRIVAVLPQTAMRGAPDRAARGVRRMLSQMRAAGLDEVLRWDDEIAVVEVTSTSGPQPASGPLPVLAVGGAHDEPVAKLLLGVRAQAPVLGLVAVQRGYLRSVGVDFDMADDHRAATVWMPAGPNFPNEAPDAQPALTAFAVERVTGRGAVLGRRVSSIATPLTREQEAQVVDLEPDGASIGVTSMLDLPTLALQAACGRPPSVPLELQVHLPQPGWIVGRYWLHEMWLRVLHAVKVIEGDTQAQAAIDDGYVPVVDARLAAAYEHSLGELTAPVQDLASSWSAVARDQRGLHRLGPLLSPAEATYLPEVLLAQMCVAATPAQGWLWSQISALLDHDESRHLLERARQQWGRWPHLHEPDHFVGVNHSNRR